MSVNAFIRSVACRAWARFAVVILLAVPLGSCDLYTNFYGPHYARQYVPTNFEVARPTYTSTFMCLFAVFPVTSFSNNPPYVSANEKSYVAFPPGQTFSDFVADKQRWVFAEQTPGYAVYCLDKNGRQDIGEEYRSVFVAETTLYFWAERGDILIAYDPIENVLYMAGRPH